MNEPLARKIAILLVQQARSAEEIEQIADEAKDMAYRAYRAKDDPSWWELVGRPHFNKQMAKIRKVLEKEIV